MFAAGPTLNPRFNDPQVLAALREAWVARRRIRVPDLLAPGLATRVADTVMTRPFSFFEKHVSEIRCVLWRYAHAYPGPYDPPDAPVMAEVRRLFQVDLPALASAITGQALRRVDGDRAVFDCYLRGSYLDAHTDQGADRQVAYVLGLTRDRWPAEQGGHLEFLAADEHEVIDRVAPGFDTLDLFCVYPLLQPHRIPLLEANVVRLSINGWFTGELKGPGELSC